jgi:hypothetical protein
MQSMKRRIRSALKGVIGVWLSGSLLLGSVLFGSVMAHAGPDVSEGRIASIWPVIPFFPLGDIGQYEKTISRDRDQVRKMFWDELMGALGSLAEKGAPVEMMLEPMANTLLFFDQVHDMHKAKDVIQIDLALETRFKAAFDELYRIHDVRDTQRKAQFSRGSDANLIQAYIRGLSGTRPLGRGLSRSELDAKIAMTMVGKIDYVAYGTFSSLGRGQVQLTFHLTGNKSGVSRAFISQGRLTNALDDLAKQVFDFFQKNVHADWKAPHGQLEWLPMPSSPGRDHGYTWEEARGYCRARGYRLPYARELMLAQSGGAYKAGGIGALQYKMPYSVADKRSSNDNYVFTPGHEDATGGPVQGASYSMSKGKFWCVKGTPSGDVMTFEKVWSLIRQHRDDQEIYRALETVRYEIGDFGSGSPVLWGRSFVKLERLSSLDEALGVLSKRGIRLEIPESLRN